MKTVTLTEQEEELIMTLRNYKRSFPNGYPELLYYAQRLFDEMTDLPLVTHKEEE